MKWRLPPRTLGLTFASQAASSLSNFLISIMAGRLFGAAGLGEFTVLLGVCLVYVGVHRALLAEPMGTFSVWIEGRFVGAVRASLLIGLLLLPAWIALAVVVDGRWGIGLLLSAVVQAAALQDLFRYRSFTIGRPVNAVMSDLVWVVVMVLALVGLMLGDRLNEPVDLFVAWGMGAAVAGLPVLTVLSATVPRAARDYAHSIRRLGPFTALQTVVSGASSQFLLVISASIIGAAGLGEFRVAQLLTMPIAMLLPATQPLLFTRLRTMVRPRDAAFRLARQAALLGLALVPVLGLASQFWFDLMLRGDPSRPLGLVVLVSLALVPQLYVQPLIAALKLEHRGRAIFGIQFWASVLGVAIALPSMIFGGGSGFAAGLLAQAILSAALTSRVALRRISQEVSSQ